MKFFANAGIGLFLIAAATSRANPISFENVDPIFYEVRKQSEACIVMVRDLNAFVSCAIDYQLDSKGTSDEASQLQLAVPVFVPQTFGEDPSYPYLWSQFRPSIEVNGVQMTSNVEPETIDEALLPTFRAPQGSRLYWFGFQIPLGPNKATCKLLVSYHQPIIEGRFYYLPLFESAWVPRDATLSCVLTAEHSKLQLVGNNHRATAFGHRIDVPMSDRTLIVIQINEP